MAAVATALRRVGLGVLGLVLVGGVAGCSSAGEGDKAGAERKGVSVPSVRNQGEETEGKEEPGAHGKLTKTRPLTAQEEKTAAVHCERSFFCVWKGTKIKGTPDRSYRGDMEDPPFAGPFAVYNKGGTLPGADHVHLKWRYYNGDHWGSGCLHYAPGPGHYMSRGGDVILMEARWGGEC